MAEKTYTVMATAFGHMLNREVVDKAAMEGRIVPPLVKYLTAGDDIKLDPSSDATKRALESGALEEPGASDQRRAEQLQSEMDALKARQAALAAQIKTTA
jgi:hypothetical protein